MAPERVTLYVCPECGLVADAVGEDDDPRFLSCTSRHAPTPMAPVEYALVSPGDSAPASPEHWVWLGDEKHPTWQDYMATNLLALLKATEAQANTGDWYWALRSWCERHSSGEIKPNLPRPAPTKENRP